MSTAEESQLLQAMNARLAVLLFNTVSKCAISARGLRLVVCTDDMLTMLATTVLLPEYCQFWSVLLMSFYAVCKICCTECG